MAACNKTKAAAREGRDSGFNEAQGLAACDFKDNKSGVQNPVSGGEVSLDFLRRRFVRRKVRCGPELSAYLADMAFQSKGFRNE